MRTSQRWNATLAAIVALALVSQIGIAVGAPAFPAGHAVGTLRGTNVFGRIVRVLSFFTIQSNILITVAAATLALRPDRDGPWWRPLRTAGLIGITVTGIVYTTVLAKVHEPHGWAETTTNFVFHFLAPLGIAVGWLLFGPRPRISGRAWLALLWPCAWFAWTLAHGATTDWYPYPFVDVVTHGYAVVLRNAAAVIAVLAAVAGLFAWGDRALPRSPRSDAPSPSAGAVEPTA